MLRILVSFDLDQEYVDRIRTCMPGIDIQKGTDPSALVLATADAEVLLAGRFTKDMFAAARKLKWVQAVAAGVDRFLFPEFVSSEVMLTNARGIHFAQVSDHALALILAFSRRLNTFMRYQLERRWAKLECDELQRKVIGIVGLGVIGREIARKAKCFGMKVLAVDKDTTAPPSYVDELFAPSGLRTLLERSEFVVLSVPLTRETKGMIGEQELSTMRRDAVLVNVSRGRIVRQHELVGALKDGTIAGAGLDVFEEEPLPPDCELWRMENVIITPHVAGSTPDYWTRICDVFCENLRRYTSGQRLVNLVDKKLGY